MSWEKVTVENIVLPEKGSIASGPFGSSISSKFFVEEGIPVIRGNNLTIGDKRFIDSGFVFLTEQKAAEFKNCETTQDDIVLTAAGTIGQVGIIPKEARYDRYIISNKQLRFRCDKSKVVPLFVYYWLSSSEMTKYIVSRNTGSTIPLINLSILRKLPIPLPPLVKQQKIASILSTYDDLIENNLRRIELLEQSAQFLYKEWFVHLRFPGYEHTKIVDSVPEGWELTSLKYLAEINQKSLQTSYHGEIEYIDISSVTAHSINSSTTYEFEEAPSRARRIVKHGDILWSCVRPNRRSHAIIWNPSENLIASTGFAVITPVSLPTSYLYYSLTTNSFVGYLTNNARGAAYPAVKASDFEKATILVPSRSFIDAFDEFVKPLVEQSQNLRDQNQKLQQARNLLLPKLMSGEIVV